MFYLPVILLLNYFCLSFARSCSVDDHIRQLDVTVHVQYYLEDYILRTNHKTFSIYYSDDLVLYNLGYHFDSSVNGVLVKKEYRKYFFVYRKGERMGYRFDTNEGGQTGYFSVDSVLYSQALGSFTWEKLAAIEPGSSFDPGTGVLKEMYTNKEMKGDTVWLYFSNRLREYDYSLSPKLDSLKNLKLFKIVVHNDPYYEPAINRRLPEKNNYILLEEGRLDNLEPIRYYFTEYKKMNPK